MIPKIIHFVALPPYPSDIADRHVKALAITHPDYEVMVHTKEPENYVFDGLPVFGPAQRGSLLRLDVLRRYGGWYFDIDCGIFCKIEKLEKVCSLGKNLAMSWLRTGGVCQFVSAAPDKWDGWEEMFDYIIAHPRKAKGHYCTTLMGRYLKDKPTLVDFIPHEMTHSKHWVWHKL